MIIEMFIQYVLLKHILDLFINQSLKAQTEPFL